MDNYVLSSIPREPPAPFSALPDRRQHLCLEMSNMGKYSCRISQKKWKDTETIRLEDCFYGFISGLFKAAAVKKSGMPEEGKGDEEMTDQDME